MSKLNVLVAGSTGYIGLQLIKLLQKHRKIKIKYLCGNSSVGKKISYYDKSLSKKKLPKIVKFNQKLLNGIDVVFTALPNGEAQKLWDKYTNYKDEMFEKTNTKIAPWNIISADRKIDARIEAINLILKNISYDKSTQTHSKKIKF